MRLYLSSLDLGAHAARLPALAGGTQRCAIVLNALDHRPEARVACQRSHTEALAALGLAVDELDLRRYFGASAALATRLDALDMIWVTGGNPFILRRAMRQSGFELAGCAAVQRARLLYAGCGAAAAITARSLRGLDNIDDPEDTPPGYEGAVVWDGLRLLPFALAVHYRCGHPHGPAVELLTAFYENEGMPYRTLADGAVLVVDGRDVQTLA
jgi:dipeptidase E